MDGDYENTQSDDQKKMVRHDSVGGENGGIPGDQALLAKKICRKKL
jgi:hypothetical protein